MEVGGVEERQSRRSKLNCLYSFQVVCALHCGGIPSPSRAGDGSGGFVDALAGAK